MKPLSYKEGATKKRMKVLDQWIARLSVLKLFVGAPVGPKTGVRHIGANPVLGLVRCAY